MISSAQLLTLTACLRPLGKFSLFQGYSFYSSFTILLLLLSISLALLTSFPQSSGFQKRRKTWYRNCQITPGTQFEIYSICCLLSCRSSFFSTLVFKVFQFSIFLVVEFAGGQLCKETILGLQWQISSANITASEKSRLMLFFGRENGMLSTILQTSSISLWFIPTIKIIQIE